MTPQTPVWGWHEPVTRHGRHLGAVIQVNDWIPVCAGCYQPLPGRGSRLEARAELRDHWDTAHRKATA